MKDDFNRKLKKINSLTISYEYKHGFIVDVTDTGSTYEVYLYHSEYGIKEYMFGLVKKDFTSNEELLDLIVSNLEKENYIRNYQERYIKER